MTPVLISSSALQVAGRLRLDGFVLQNPNAAVAFLQVFDASTTGAVTLGTTAPVASFPIPGSGTISVMLNEGGVGVFNGVVIAVTTTLNGSAAPASPLAGTVLVD